MSTVTLEQLLSHSKLETKEAELLAGGLVGLSNTEIFLKKDKYEVSQKTVAKFRSDEKKILSGLPLQYILGKCNFYGREFIVNKNVLIPRVETEILVLQALKFFGLRIKNNESWQKNRIRIIDIGTGSGCIAISLYKELKKLFTFHFSLFTLFATDISSSALRIAKKNARKHLTKVKFYKSDLFSNPRLPKKFDLILANLPYLSSNYTKENKALRHEPKLALHGGKNGLDIIEKLISELSDKLSPEGLAILEIDPRQKQELQKYLRNIAELNFSFKKDLNKRVRYLLINKR